MRTHAPSGSPSALAAFFQRAESSGVHRTWNTSLMLSGFVFLRPARDFFRGMR